MTISELMQSMMDAGAPMEAILVAVKAIEERDRMAAEVREKAAERKRRQRDRERDCHVDDAVSVSRRGFHAHHRFAHGSD